jgi:hypothetical protein
MRNLPLASVPLAAALLAVAAAPVAHAERPGQALDQPRGRLLTLPAPCPGPGCAASPQAKGPRLVYLNFDGVSLTRSTTRDDAVTGESAIVQANMTIPAFSTSSLSSTGGMSRAQIIQRVVDQMYFSHADYDVDFVTTRPASAPYSMVVFGGSCSSVAGETGCAGLALLDCGDLMPHNITFVFPGGLHYDDLASTASQEAAHAFGLAHTTDQTDIMYPYLQSNFVPTRFGAGPLPQGDDSCGGALYQDSDARMLQVIGPRGQDVTGPEITVTTPQPGQVVAVGDPVQAQITDASPLARAELLIAGTKVAETTSAPWSFQIPGGTETGNVDLLYRVYDSEGNYSQVRVQVYLLSGDEEPCGPGDSCSIGLECQGGLCVPSPGGLGTTCTMNEECVSGICAESDGEQRCSQQCSDSEPCPGGFDCRGGVACWPAKEKSGGCSASGGRAVSLLGLLWLAWLGASALVLRRRRPRRFSD